MGLARLRVAFAWRRRRRCSGRGWWGFAAPALLCGGAARGQVGLVGVEFEAEVALGKEPSAAACASVSVCCVIF